ncbi:MAG: DNA polymerase IV [Kineosporiaceae bacterium]
MSREHVARADGRPMPEGRDDTGCHLLHVDMDAFYASVELRDRPDLQGTPVIVGGGARGVVLSATYEARRHGVRAAMPMTRARRLCPRATIIAPHHDRYAEVSRGVMELFRSITPLVEPLSLDEAFLDVAGARRRLGPPAAVARLIRDRVADEQRITCSVGVAATKFVAKLASSAAKPDGMLVVPAADTVAFLHSLPVTALWGVGPRTGETLTRLGLRTVADVAHVPRATLIRALGEAQGAHLHDLSWGRDSRPVVPHTPDKSVGSEETFARDVDDPAVVRREILRLSERVASRLRAGGSVGRTVVLKVRFADFTTITRSRSLSRPTDLARDVRRVAAELYDALGLDRARIRLVGVRVENLGPAAGTPVQLALDAAADDGWRDAERAADRARARFGAGIVRPATLVDRRASRTEATDPGGR